jgi:hypothetical protein
MFHLYFGAFDIVLYLGGAYVAMVLAEAICEDRPKAKTLTQTHTSVADQPSVSAGATVNIPQPKKTQESQPVRVGN